MRALLLAAVLLLNACAATVPMAELERQAMLTGDWSAVERRERRQARRADRYGPSCGPGRLSYCERSGSRDRCACVDGRNVWNRFNSRR